MVAATGAGDRAELDTLAEHLAGLGRAVDRLTGRELRRLEPALGPDVRGGLSVPDDLAVDNRVLLAALRAAAERAGVRFVAERRAGRARRRRAGDRGAHRRPGCGRAEQVLVAAGAHSAGLHPALRGLVRPVKGEVLRLAHRAGALPPPSRTVRALVDGRPVYAVPRDGGGLVIGATQAEQGFDTEVTVGGVRDLLRDAERVLPGIAEYALVETRGRAAPGQPGQPAADRGARARTGCSWPPGTTATACCSPRSPPTRCWRCSPATRCPTRSGPPTRGVSPSNQQGGSRCRCGSTGSRGSWPTAPGCATCSTELGAPRTGVAVAVDGAVVPAGGLGATPRWPTARGSRC